MIISKCAYKWRISSGRNEIVECLIQLSPDRYRGHSLLIREGQLFLTMWALLTRVGADDETKVEDGARAPA